LLGYAFLVVLCYLVSGSVVKGSPLSVITLLLSVPLVIILYEKPVLSIFLLFLLLNTVFAYNAFPLPLWIGDIEVYPTELVLLLGLLALFKDAGTTLKEVFDNHPLKKALWPFLLTVLLCTLWNITYLNVPFMNSEAAFVGRVRVFALYFVFFIILQLLRSETELRRLTNCLFAFAVFGAIMHVLIFFTKGDVFLTDLFPAYLKHSKAIVQDSFQSASAGYLRFANPATPLLRSLFFIALSFYLHLKDKKYLRIAIILGSAIVLQFSRMAWVSILVVFPLFFPIMRRNLLDSRFLHYVPTFSLKKYFAFVVLFGFGVFLLGNYFHFSFAVLIQERMSTLFLGGEDASIGSRMNFFTITLSQLVSSPLKLLFGAGLSYTGSDNFYLDIIWSLGLLGLFTYLWFIYQYIKYGLRAYYQIQDLYLKAACLGAVMSILRLMVNAFSGNFMATMNWIPTLCFLFALPYVCLKIDNRPEKTD